MSELAKPGIYRTWAELLTAVALFAFYASIVSVSVIGLHSLSGY